ncbi:MAG: Menaquinone reductase, iron-sulfur cluster-binding subunit [Calditrichaeota bacterium]|nr:Menaquinone reductase, iron-sulfur cluster-binding subunit [Calditrichota bacterium]
MIIDRRNFVRVAGLGALGAAAAPASTLLAEPAASRAKTASAKPLTAKRWAMVVDTRKATEENVRAAIDACHREHNVPDLHGTKDEIKWIWAESFEHAFHEQDLHYIPSAMKQAPTLLLCNHCDDPPCTQVCPTGATFKRERDGIVMMDWHRCIGCRYCIVACPYGSRSFNFRDPRAHIAEIDPEYPTRMRGVVEKCTFCEERLARGREPACVEATKASGMMVFGDLEDPDSEVSRAVRAHFCIRRKPGLGTQPEVYYIVPEVKTRDRPQFPPFEP